MKPIEDMGNGELAKNIIYGVALGGVVASLFVAPKLVVAYKWVGKLHKEHKRLLKDNLKRLVNRDYICLDKHGGYFITPKGTLKLYKYKIQDLKVLKPKSWDKIWRIITFDIPEDKKIARMALNKKLKELGFITLQKSVFIFPYPCEEEFIEIGEFFGVRKNIIFIEAKKVSNEKELKKQFKKKKIM